MLRAILKLFRSAPLVPVPRGRCHHCWHHYPVTELSRREKVFSVSEEGRATSVFYDLCPVCALMEPKLLSIRITRGSWVVHIWEGEDGESYERYQFGKKLADD